MFDESVDTSSAAEQIFEAVRASGIPEMTENPHVMLNRVVVVAEYGNWVEGTKWLCIIGAGGEKGEATLTRWDIRGLLQEADLRQVRDA